MTTDGSKATPLKGRILVASPHAAGTPYERRFVLILQHGCQRAFGLILDDRFLTTLKRIRMQWQQRSNQNDLGNALIRETTARIIAWKSQRLEYELGRELWRDPSLDPELLGNQNHCEWAQLVREVGRSIYRDTLCINTTVPHPSLN